MQSTQTILSNKGQPGRVHFVEKFENVKELIVQSGLSYQMIVSQEISEIERPLFGTGASALSVPQVDAKYLRQLGLLQQWYVFRGERTGILRFLEQYPFLVSFITFGAVMSQIGSTALSLSSLNFAFQNGFFWQTLMKTRQKS